MKNDTELYPRIYRAGMHVNYLSDSPYVEGWRDWCKANQSYIKEMEKRYGPEAWTMSEKGPYPWDVEKFLRGLPNGD